MIMVVGNVYKFDYLQGSKDESRVGRVIKLRDTYLEPLSHETLMRNRNIVRSRFLFTVRTSDGQCRNMYEHAMFAPHKVGILGRVLLWLKGVRV